MTIVGNHSAAGWGSIEKKVSERDRQDKTAYDFLDQHRARKIPAGKIGCQGSDVLRLLGAIHQAPIQSAGPRRSAQPGNRRDPERRRTRLRYEKQTIDYTQRKSLNFTNVRKTKTGAAPKTRIYDVENLNFTYAYTEIYQRNYNIAYSLYKTHSGLIGYNYNKTGKPISRSRKSLAS